MTITLTWHLMALIIIELIGLLWVATRDSSSGYLGSERDWAGVAYVVLSMIAISIYGGIFWW